MSYKISQLVAVGLLVLIISSAFAAVASTSPNQPTASVNISKDAFDAQQPDISNVGSQVYIAWQEGSRGVFFRESPNNGTIWVPPLTSPGLKISPAKGTAQYPLISANGSNVYVTWSETAGTNTTLQIYLAYSTNNGQSFSEENVTDINASVDAITPVVASWGSFVVVGWTSNSQSFVRASDNGGATWNKAYLIPGSYHEPQVSVWGTLDGYVVSDEGFAYTHNGGVSWSSVNKNTRVGSEPWISTWGSNVYITGEGKNATSQIEYSHSTNNGVSFTPVVNISQPLADVWAPMLWAFGNNVWIAFHTYPGGNAGLEYVMSSHNNGTTFGIPSILSATKTNVGFPFTVWSNDGINVFVGWPQQVGTSSVWVLRMAYSPNSGNTWTTPPGFNMSQNSVGQGSNQNDVADGAIAANGNLGFAVWQYIPTTGNSQIYFSTLPGQSGITTTSSTSTTTTSSTSTTTTSSTSTTTTSSTTNSTSSSNTTSTSSISNTTSSSNTTSTSTGSNSTSTLSNTTSTLSSTASTSSNSTFTLSNTTSTTSSNTNTTTTVSTSTVTTTSSTIKVPKQLLTIPSTIMAGQNYLLTGHGFPLNTNLTIEWGPQVPWPNSYVVTNSTGGFSITLEAPTTAAFSGSHTLKIYNGATDIFQIQVIID